MHRNMSDHYPKRYGIYKEQETSINLYSGWATISSSLMVYLSIDNEEDKVVVVVVSFISNRIQQWNNTRKKKTLCRYP